MTGKPLPNSGLQTGLRIRRRPLPRGCWPSARLSIGTDGGNRLVPRQRPRKYPILKRIEYDTCMPERTVIKLRRLLDGGFPLL